MTESVLSMRILGCGSSGGVPRIGGNWGACDPLNPKNRRSRCSALIRVGQRGAPEDDITQILIDTAPDMRNQLLAASVHRLDAVLITHDHADQCNGIDDLRAFALTHKKTVPVYMDAVTSRSLHRRFGYCFKGHKNYPPIARAVKRLRAGQTVCLPGPGGEIEALVLKQNHGAVHSLGFRFGPVAYCNDVKAMSSASFERLEGLELFCVDALRYQPHASHAHLDLALEWIERLRPRRSILTNLHIDLDYAALKAELPDGVEPAYDGMEIELPLARS